jgi:hypothetical protein
MGHEFISIYMSFDSHSSLGLCNALDISLDSFLSKESKSFNGNYQVRFSFEISHSRFSVPS